MKISNIISFVPIIAVALITSAHKVHLLRSGQIFVLFDPTRPFDPQAYEASDINPILECPGSGEICFIEIPSMDIYPAGHANAGKPKVDIATSLPNELSDDIQTALANASDPTSFPSRQRIIHETQL